VLTTLAIIAASVVAYWIGHGRGVRHGVTIVFKAFPVAVGPVRRGVRLTEWEGD
jgi:hypothetical protein